ncbi:translation elongation factor G2 [Pyrenophora tritici-repentis]|uniref:Ribosome-releasing factor 2, mitochondrial n=1 Tax=Pyrenophora tritici-repentis TaxID=45151 RepID=A0A2W1H8J1_9PLEO|nr:translation elongation factor G2 [Pyrenophora tritici-repentis]KAF7443176.1 translation elongation factor G2 [Pyrenophora tritici-repentis]KAF7568352.1 FusA, Translation elongation factors (GTPase) [Pyrenophora tritici-repentis]KAI0581786.1 translation elongation factor G2 [Pyrenophora tritici-repentis]KAI1592109.1 FusA Translation elongation factors GTPase [Pyrenophora tritici-repentis]
MRTGWVVCARTVLRHNVKTPRRLLSTQTQPQHDLLSKATRNIGIIAHIDAGKTTTTERMLYYSGVTRRIGNVDEGSTVTDFLPAERARGITIQSAAITFHWPPLPPNAQTPPPALQLPESFDNVLRSSASHNINLIDTPGHADFTFEVLRSLRVLDGAVCILDGVAGVEAQTEKVWTQAGHYHIPRIIFVNKLDRVGAAFSRTVKEIGTRLNGWPAVCQIPWWQGENGDFVGVGDVVNLRGMLWKTGGDGRDIQAFSLEDLEKTDGKFAEEIKKARIALVEILSEHDDVMVEHFLEHDEDHLAISGIQIMHSLRRVVLQAPQKVVPVFAGASFRNIGVQPLLDSVVDLLPSPLERPDPEISIAGQRHTLSALLDSAAAVAASKKPSKSGRKPQQQDKGLAIAEVKNLVACALAFKVVNDPKRGVLVYVRVYSGSIDRGSTLYNTNLSVAERAPRLLKMYANDAVEVESIGSGQIGVITGLKYARTGDTLIVYRGLQMKGTPPGALDTLQLRPIAVPPPVFFTSIEPNSLSEQKHVQESLEILLREDPSLHLSVDDESGQTHLAGMGDLHLEIARDRLLNDLKAKARIGKIEIGYRETITTTSTEPFTFELDKLIAVKQAKAGITVFVEPIDDKIIVPGTQQDEQQIQDSVFETTYKLPDNNTLHIAHPNLSSHDSASHKNHIPPHLSLPSILHSIQAGASATLARGPFNGFPVANTRVSIQLDARAHLFPETTPTAISMAVRAAVGASLRTACNLAPTVLLEPVMNVTIFVNENSMGAVVQDISSSRGGQVLSLDGSISTSSSEEIDIPRIDPNLIYTPPDPFSSGTGDMRGEVADGQRQIVARVPLKEMVGYLNHLRALTGGRGTFVMSVDGFEKMASQRQKEVLDAMREF